MSAVVRVQCQILGCGSLHVFVMSECGVLEQKLH